MPLLNYYRVSLAQPVFLRVPALPSLVAEDLDRCDDAVAAYEAVRIRHDVETAIFVSSRSLHSALTERRVDERRALRACAYLARMATRTTPFGMLAHVGTCTWGDRTTAVLESGERRTKTRPDMGWLHDYVGRLTADAAARRHFEVRFAENVVVRGGRLSLVAGPAKESGGRRASYAQASLKWSPFLRELRDRTTVPGTRWADAVDWIAERFAVSTDAADAQFLRLHELGFLALRLEPPLTTDPLDALASYLPAGFDEQRQELDRIAALCEAFDRSAPSARISAARTLDATMRSILPSKAETTQVDGFVTLEGTVNRSVVEALQPLMTTYVRCSRRTHLTKFREEFARRYEGFDARVPLLEVADPDDGLTDYLVIEKDDAVRAEPLRAYQLAKLVDQARRDGSRIAHLSASELDAILPPAPDPLTLPASADFGFQLFAESNAAIDAGRFLVSTCPLIYTSAAGRASGRFSSEVGVDVLEHVESVATASLEHDAVVAELVYRPKHERSQNVAIRQTWCRYRIYDGYSPEDGVNVIPLSDLYVGVRGGRTAVFSRTLERRIVLHENHVLNMALAPPISRALIAFSLDERRSLEAFDWGPFAHVPFVPRLQIDRTIVALARWRLPRSIVLADDDGRSFDEWCENWDLRGWVYLKDLDARLPVNVDSALGRRLLADQSRGVPAAGFVELEEALIGETDTWLSDGSRRFASEFVVSASRIERDTGSAVADGYYPDAGATRVCRDERWVYVRIHGARSRQDLLLRDYVAPLITALRGQARLSDWFFTRYGPPDHLRLRLNFQSDVASAREELIAGLLSLSRDAVITEYELAQYKPELERYGGETGLAVAHDLFRWSSEWALADIVGVGSDGRGIRAAAAFQRSVVDALPRRTRAAWLAGARAGIQAGKKADRVLLKALGDRAPGVDVRGPSTLGQRVCDAIPEDRLAAFVRNVFHMHFNRCGLPRAEEETAYATLVAAHYGLTRRAAC